VSEQSDRPGGQPSGSQAPGDPVASWERRVSELSGDLQRWLIKTSARNVRDDLGDQVKRAIRGPRQSADDVWDIATTEPPDALDQAPECAWCPICRAARRMAQAQAQAAAQAAARSASGRTQASGDTSGGDSGRRDAGDREPGDRDGAGQGVPAWYGAADALVGAARDALSGLDAILSYRPQEAGTGDARDSGTVANPANGSNQATADEADISEKSKHEPDHRG